MSEYKNKREEYAIELRRKNREERMEKRRNMGPSISQKQNPKASTNNKKHVIDPRFREAIQKYHAMDLTQQSILTLLQALVDPDPANQLYGVIGIRQHLCVPNNAPVQTIVDAGTVPTLIKYASQVDFPQLQLEATWCLANIAAGTSQQCRSIIEKGGILIFINLILSEHFGIVEQAVWALANIACDTPNYRDRIIEYGGIKNLIQLITIAQPLLKTNPGLGSIIETATWALSNIARAQPRPEFRKIKEALPIFFMTIKQGLIKSEDVIANVLWAMSYFVNRKIEKDKLDKLQYCLDSKVVQSFPQYIKINNPRITVPCLKIIASIASGTKSQTEQIINIGIIDMMETFLLPHPNKTIRKTSCLIISNILLSSPMAHQKFRCSQSLIQLLLKMFWDDLPEVQVQICYIFGNFLALGQPEAMFNLYKQLNIMTYFCQIIRKETENHVLLGAMLDNLEPILSLGQKMAHLEPSKKNYFKKCLFEENVIDKFEELQLNQNVEVYETANRLIQMFFQIDSTL